MKTWLRIISLALVLLMTLSAMPVFAAEGEPEEDTPEDIVLLLDCSSSLTKNDPKNLCLEACKNFIDQLPTQNARISVIGFGLGKGEEAVYSASFKLDYFQDSKSVRTIVPLTGMGDSAQKSEYKKTLAKIIADTRGAASMGTPLGHALAAAVSLLENNGTEAGKACIIMVSDGVHTPRTVFQDERFIESASKLAGENQWPIYTVGLGYNIGNTDEATAANKLMSTICANSGQDQIGAINCATPTDVFQSFKSIFADFYGIESVPAQPMNLPGEEEFTIPPLTSEATVDIFGAGIGKVILTYQDQGTEWVITKSEETANRIVVVEKGSYVSIKLICPADGNWKVRVEPAADAQFADATVLFSHIPLQEMGLTMTAVPSSTAEVLTKNDEIKINAVFAYRGTTAEPTEFYNENPATLKMYFSDGSTKSVLMDTSRDGYSYTLKLNDPSIPMGSVEVQVELSHTMFRNGKKVSETATFKTQNLPLELGKTEPMTLQAFVNSEFERVDLNAIYKNPDNDPVEYTFSCTDREKTFEHTFEEGYLKIQSGLEPGTYPVQIGATDPDMSEPLVYSFNLVVENREPVLEGTIALPQLWLQDWPEWLQEVGKTEAEVDLSTFFSDPDGMPLSYTLDIAPMTTEEGTVNVADAQLTGNKFHVAPAAAGKTTITITCSDGLSQISTTVDVEVVSAKSVYWKENSWWIIVAVIALVILLIIVAILRGGTMVKGSWNITITDSDGNTCEAFQVFIPQCTGVGKKKKFKLSAMLSELNPYFDGDNSVISTYSNYFLGNEADNIVMQGVALGKGCTVNKLPKNSAHATVSVNGIQVNKKTRIKYGNLTMVVRTVSDPDNYITVRMDLA